MAFAFVATHNHFVLDRGGKVFNRSAPVIKLPPGATEDDHLALLGLLNSSTAGFWMKQVFHNKAGSGIGRGIQPEAWMDRYEFDSTKLQIFPIPPDREATLPHARALDHLARTRTERSVAAVLAAPDWTDTAGLRRALTARHSADFADFTRMVALQEELDWLCYRLYGLDEGDVVPPEDVVPCLPTDLPWVVAMAESEQPTAWFERHGWDPGQAGRQDAGGPWPASGRDTRIAERRARTLTNPALALIETANFKRRWYKPDHAAEEQDALDLWLADRIEDVARTRTTPFTLDHLVSALQDDARVLAVAEVLTGRPDFSLSQLVAETVAADAVPQHAEHIYKPGGLIKRAAWERTWADQRREDAGESVKPDVPPAYGSGDFLRTEYWQLRGKLDVPKERFITFTEAPTSQPVYGWAGWTPLQRIRAILALDEDLEDQGQPITERIALLDGAWRLLPDAAREDVAAAGRLKAELQALVGLDGPNTVQLAQWNASHPPPRGRAGRAKRPNVSDDEE